MSVESFNQDSLDLLVKDITVAQVQAALELLSETRIPCEVNLIFFDPYVTLDGVRRNLMLLDYLRQSDTLAYSDAFPFNELMAFPWSRVGGRLQSEGLLQEGRTISAYRDARVARLVAFVRQLRRHAPLVFKKRLLFDSLDGVAAPELGSPPTRDSLLRVAEGLRRWVGLVVLPEYIRAACDLIETGGRTEPGALAELESSFVRSLEPLRNIERAMRAAFGQVAFEVQATSYCAGETTQLCSTEISGAGGASPVGNHAASAEWTAASTPIP
jgi:hypothetical protein